MLTPFSLFPPLPSLSLSLTSILHLLFFFFQASIFLFFFKANEQASYFLEKNKNSPKQMSIFFHHKIYQPKCISMPILYLPFCMKCLCFAKTIISPLYWISSLFIQLKTSFSYPLWLPTTRSCSRALKHALMEPIL